MSRIITPVQPGVPGVIGASVLTNIPGTFATTGAPPSTNNNPRIIYGPKVIDLPTFPYRWQVNPTPLRTLFMAGDGTALIALYNRIDAYITGGFHMMEKGAIHNVLFNWWQWALKGYGWFFTLNASKTVDTALTVDAASNILRVVNPAGITAGFYKLIYRYLYELVEVVSVVGDTVTLSAVPNATFPAGSKFRDQLHYRCVVRSPEAPNPITDCSPMDNEPPGLFKLDPEFFEDFI